MALSNDGTLLASGGADHTVKIWDPGTGNHLHTLTGHTEEVNSVAFSSDGNRLVSGASDGKILVWDTKEGSLLNTLEGSPGPVYAVCFSPSMTSRPAHELTERSWLGQKLHDIGFFFKQVFTNESLYDIPAEETSKILKENGWVISGGRDGEKDDEYSHLRIWDTSEGKLVRSLKGHKQAISTVLYKPDLRVILSGSPDGSIRLWQPWAISETADDQSYKTFSGYTRGVTAMAATHGGTMLVTASNLGYMHVWDMDQGISLAKGGLRGVFLSIFALVLSYPIGALIDRFNPIRLFIWTAAIALPFPLLFFFFFHTYTFGLYMEILQRPCSMLHGMATLPMLIMILPKSKYGQFCSANAMVRQSVAAVAGPLGAVVMDYLTTNSLETDYFRYGYLCQFVAHALSLFCMIGVYYYWRRLGGDNYVAPEA